MTPRPYKIAVFHELLWFTGWEGENEPELIENLRARSPYFSFFADLEPLWFVGRPS